MSDTLTTLDLAPLDPGSWPVVGVCYVEQVGDDTVEVHTLHDQGAVVVGMGVTYLKPQGGYWVGHLVIAKAEVERLARQRKAAIKRGAFVLAPVKGEACPFVSGQGLVRFQAEDGRVLWSTDPNKKPAALERAERAWGLSREDEVEGEEVEA